MIIWTPRFLRWAFVVWWYGWSCARHRTAWGVVGTSAYVGPVKVCWGPR